MAGKALGIARERQTWTGDVRTRDLAIESPRALGVQLQPIADALDEPRDGELLLHSVRLPPAPLPDRTSRRARDFGVRLLWSSCIVSRRTASAKAVPKYRLSERAI